MDAVYIAWGRRPKCSKAKTKTGGDRLGYYGGWMEENRYWYHRTLLRDYQPRTFVRAEVVFVNGTVRSWRNLPQPVY